MNGNNLGKLNDLLFSQMERLDKAEKGEELQSEVSRAHAIQGVAKEIISNANLILQAKKWNDDKWDANSELPSIFKVDEDE